MEQQYEQQPDKYQPPKLDGRMYKLGRRELGLIILTVVALALVGWFAWRQDRTGSINSFAECVAAGNPVMESYPEQCAAGGQTWSNPAQQLQLTPDASPEPDAATSDSVEE